MSYALFDILVQNDTWWLGTLAVLTDAGSRSARSEPQSGRGQSTSWRSALLLAGACPRRTLAISAAALRGPAARRWVARRRGAVSTRRAAASEGSCRDLAAARVACARAARCRSRAIVVPLERGFGDGTVARQDRLVSEEGKPDGAVGLRAGPRDGVDLEVDEGLGDGAEAWIIHEHRAAQPAQLRSAVDGRGRRKQGSTVRRDRGRVEVDGDVALQHGSEYHYSAC